MLVCNKCKTMIDTFMAEDNIIEISKKTPCDNCKCVIVTLIEEGNVLYKGKFVTVDKWGDEISYQ